LTSALSLALVLAILAGLLWWVRRSNPLAPGLARRLQIVETVALGPAHRLHLVRLAGRALLVAASRDRCELLCELEELPPAPETSCPDAACRAETRLGAWFSQGSRRVSTRQAEARATPARET
jgi:flagellar biosynthetic protein FliO